MPPPAMITLVTVYTIQARADARLWSPDLPVNTWPDGSLGRHASWQRTAPPPRQSTSSAQYCHTPATAMRLRSAMPGVLGQLQRFP
jgi:hypothetical protein